MGRLLRAFSRGLWMSWALGASATASLAVEPSPGTGAAEPSVVQPQSVIVDRASGGGSAVVRFRNDSGQPLPVLLSAGPLQRVGDARIVDAPVTFAPEGERGKGKSVLPLELPTRELKEVRATVGQVWETGQFEAELQDRGKKIGTLRVSVYPVDVKLDSSATPPSRLDLVDGTPASLALTNGDPVHYKMSYRLLVGGLDLAAGDFEIAPNGSAIIDFVPSTSTRWYFARFQDLFRAETGEDGFLALYLRGPDSEIDLAAPVRRLPLKVSLNFTGTGGRAALSYFITILVLILGGVMSLVLRNVLPNRIQMLNIKEQLGRLARATSNLSSQVGSRLGVAVRVERSRLADLLKSRTAISPEFSSVISQCNQGITTLSSRVGMMQQMDLVIGQLEKLIPEGVPPSQFDQIKAGLDRATVFLGKDQATDADLQAAQAAITETSNAVGAANRANDAFGEELAKRAQTLKDDIAGKLDQRPTFQRLQDAVPGPFERLQDIPAKIDPSLYTAVDLAIAKVGLAREYVRLREGTADDERLERLDEREKKLTGYLQLDSLQALFAARLLVCQMKEDVYPERLVEALAADPPEATISMEPAVAYESQPLTFRVRFQSQTLDSASARQEWTCEWDFGDELTERGGSVSHYFLLAKEFNVVARFRDGDGHPVKDPTTGRRVEVTRAIKVKPRFSAWLGERTVTEGVRLAAALLIAVFGLVAGARDQLLKLDVLPGLLAVFLTGFGADTLKNLLTEKEDGNGSR